MAGVMTSWRSRRARRSAYERVVVISPSLSSTRWSIVLPMPRVFCNGSATRSPRPRTPRFPEKVQVFASISACCGFEDVAVFCLHVDADRHHFTAGGYVAAGGSPEQAAHGGQIQMRIEQQIAVCSPAHSGLTYAGGPSRTFARSRRRMPERCRRRISSDRLAPKMAKSSVPRATFTPAASSA